MKEYFECPEYITALLERIRYRLEIAYWTEFQEEYEDDPFGNTGNVKGFDNGTFEVHAYDWGDIDQPFNFKCGDIEISWYKYLGRVMTINREVSETEAVKMFDICIRSLENGWHNKNEKNA